MNNNNQSRQQLEATIVERASQDPTFRRALINDPKRALADFLGMALPSNLCINVLEEQPGQHYLVLPPASQTVEAMPLDDLELALVGGGRTLRPGSCGNPNCPTGVCRRRHTDRGASRRTAC